MIFDGVYREQILPLPPLKQALINKENKTKQAGGTLQFKSSTGPLQGYVCVVGVGCLCVFSLEKRADGRSGYVRAGGVCSLCSTYTLGIRG